MTDFFYFFHMNFNQFHRYVLFVVRSDNSTVINCLKILIRLARTDKETAMKIYRNRELMQNCVREFLPHAERISTKMQFYQRPQFIFIKLLRVIAAYELPIWELNVEEAVKSYIYMKGDMSVSVFIQHESFYQIYRRSLNRLFFFVVAFLQMDFIRVQIESFRLVKTICLLKKTNELYR